MTCTDTLALPFVVLLIDEGAARVGFVSLLASVSKLTHGVNMDRVFWWEGCGYLPQGDELQFGKVAQLWLYDRHAKAIFIDQMMFYCFMSMLAQAKKESKLYG